MWEVIEHIWENLDRHVSQKEMKSSSKQKAIADIYWHNRSIAPDVPGGRLGDGVRRVDWLLRYTAFGGIQRNDDAAREQCGGEVLPCTFELNCEQRFTPDKEIEEDSPPVRENNLTSGASSSRPKSRSRSRASPRVNIIE